MESELMVENRLEYNGKKITVLFDKHGNPLWKAKDVAEVVGFKNTDEAVRYHVFEEDKAQIKDFDDPREIRGLHPNTIFINESGLYALVFGSRLPRARAFKHWVTSEVLPAIRKHGEYKLKQLHKDIFDRDSMILSLNDQIQSLKLNRVDLPANNKKQPQFVLINKNSAAEFPYYVLRIQRANREVKIKKVLAFCPEAEVILSLDVSNSIILYNKLKESGLITYDGNHFYTHLSESDLITEIIELRREEV